jgi:hypothetical protein
MMISRKPISASQFNSQPKPPSFEESVRQMFADLCFQIRKQLQSHRPDAWAKMVDFCRKVPSPIDHDVLWHSGKDKPCHSDIRVEIGERIASDLDCSDDFAFFETVASDSLVIDMRNERPRS